jgi:phage gp36-like protein
VSYITNSDIELRLGTTRYVELTDDAGTGSPNPAVADEARLGAEGEVNSYLAQRYAVPVNIATYTDAGGAIKSAALDLTEHRLHARRRDVPGYVTQKRDAAIRWLQAVAGGSASLPTVPTIGLRAAATGEERVMSRDELEGL